MNDGRKKTCSWTPEEKPDQPETLKTTQNKLKTNRLKRSPKTNQTQKSDISNCRAGADFKTPTRIPKAGFRSSVAEESPSDSELQHEIIWDPTSPATPVRNGRSRRRTAVFKPVDISDIANRIAPKNKRPEEAESSLLQWIGDTAVPCTPEIREPRTKAKPARQNPVDDLLKLAKQFDFNMIQQEEAHLRPNLQSSGEAGHGDRDLFSDENDAPAPPQARSESERPPLGLEDTRTTGDDPLDNLGLVQEMEDDLDLLFESSTQQLSGGLSQGFGAPSQDAANLAPQSGAALAARARADSANAYGVARMGGAPEASTVRVSAPIASAIKQVGVADDFSDDWNSDDLLDDALVMELSCAPQHSSTQKQTDKNDGSGNTVYPRNGDKGSKSGEVQRLNRSRPESFHRGQRWIEATGNEDAGQSGFHAKNNPETQFLPFSNVPSMVPGSHSVYKTNYQPKKPIAIQQTLATTSANSTWKVQSASLVSRSDPPRAVPSATIMTTPTFSDIAAEDLDSIFASDDIWDDGADDDDDLFCEACEKVEESMAEPEPPPKASTSKPTTTGSLHAAGKRENVRAQPNLPKAQVHDRSATGHQALLSTEVLPGAHNGNTSRMYKFSQVKSATATGSGASRAARRVSERATATTVQSYQRIQDQFKKPNNAFNVAPAVSKDVNKAVGTRCSDAEIERKKQQAMERRRLRMLTSQNLRAPV